MKVVTEHNNFIYFTISLMLLLMVSGLVESVPEIQNVMAVELSLLVIQVVAYLSLNFGRYWRLFVGGMIALMVANNAITQLTDWQYAPLVGLFLALLFFAGMTIIAARRVLFSGEVSWNIVIGALAIYLLLGMIWATLYLITLEIFPLAFNGLEHAPWGENFSNALYYSYITMTSVGYGEITPAITIGRTLAYLQAVIGAFYMAVVVASLVGARSPIQQH